MYQDQPQLDVRGVGFESGGKGRMGISAVRLPISQARAGSSGSIRILDWATIA